MGSQVPAPSAGASYAQIDAAVFPYGQTEIACYTVPSGKTGYISSVFTAVATTQAVDAVLMQRPSADDVSSSYNGTLRVVMNLNQLWKRKQTHTPGMTTVMNLSLPQQLKRRQKVQSVSLKRKSRNWA